MSSRNRSAPPSSTPTPFSWSKKLRQSFDVAALCEDWKSVTTVDTALRMIRLTDLHVTGRSKGAWCLALATAGFTAPISRAQVDAFLAHPSPFTPTTSNSLGASPPSWPACSDEDLTIAMWMLHQDASSHSREQMVTFLTTHLPFPGLAVLAHFRNAREVKSSGVD